MKNFQGLFILLNFISLIIIGYSCKEDELSDERETITGTYTGIRIATYWNGHGYNHDTTNVSMLLLKSDADSIINLKFQPETNSSGFAFIYYNNTFTCIDNFHAPELIKLNDSLFFHWQPGLGPYWEDCLTRKQ
jgi:hypothetical protein